jgi:hypothetical protein
MPSRLTCLVGCLLAALVTSTSPASAAPKPKSGAVQLPHGVHLGKNGRYYKDACDHGASRYCFAQRMLPESYKPGDAIPFGGYKRDPDGSGSPVQGGMAPSDIQAAYTIPASSKAGGQIVAIVDLPDSTAYSDLSTYRSQFGLPALPQCSGLPDGTTPCFAVVDENGNPNPSGDGGEADLETSLDMDMISATCPDCSILFVAMTAALSDNGPTDQDFLTSVATAAQLGAVATSISFGGAETPGGGDPVGYTTPGHLVFASSGDTGYLLEGTPANEGGGTSPSYPASAPDVLGVGGTNLIAQAGGKYTEQVWNDESGAASSGCSTEFLMPSYQQAYGASKFGPCTHRASTDLSAAAEFTPASGAGGGIAIYISSNGWTSVVGTSAASPIVASAFVRMGIAAQVSTNFGFVYTNTAAFNNVTVGSNDNDGLCQPAGNALCTAGPGWNGPTGIGTPSGRLAAFGATPPTPTPSDDAGASAEADAAPDAGPSEDAGSSTLAPSPGQGEDSGPPAPTPAPYPTSTGNGDGNGSGGFVSGAPAPPNHESFGPSSEGGGGGCKAAPSSTPVGGAAAWLLGAMAVLAMRRRR